MVEVAGLGGLIVLGLGLWALISIISSNADIGAKVLWSVLVLALPLIGFIIWFFAGPRSASRTI